MAASIGITSAGRLEVTPEGSPWLMQVAEPRHARLRPPPRRECLYHRLLLGFAESSGAMIIVSDAPRIYQHEFSGRTARGPGPAPAAVEIERCSVVIGRAGRTPARPLRRGSSRRRVRSPVAIPPAVLVPEPGHRSATPGVAESSRSPPGLQSSLQTAAARHTRGKPARRWRTCVPYVHRI